MWWQENLRWSLQDQISLPVVLRRLRQSCDTIEGNLWSNNLVEWVDHVNDTDGSIPSPGTSNLLVQDKTPPCYNVDRIGPFLDPIHKHPLELPAGVSFSVVGWSIDRVAAAQSGGVEIVVDEQPYKAVYGLPRRDVAEVFRAPNYVNTGFFFTMPAALFGRGTHSLAIRVISADKASFRQGVTLAVSLS
jgi:hypothetical protein